MIRKRIKLVLVAALVLAVLVVAFHAAYHLYLKVAYPLKHEAIVTAYAEQFELPPSLIYAVIQTESHFREDAVSSAGAKGLMQLMDGTYEWIQTKLPGEPEPVERIFEPEVNIRCGSKLLAVLYGQFDRTETVLAAYNAGIGTVQGWLADERYSDDGVTLSHIPIEETDTYVKRVLKAQQRYQALYDME